MNSYNLIHLLFIIIDFYMYKKHLDNHKFHNYMKGVNKIMAKITEILTKLILRNDVTSTWEKSTIVLEKGEPALEMDLVKKVAKIKIGDGQHTFKDLPYSTATPEEIQKMIDNSIANNQTGIKSVSLTSGTDNGTVKLIVDGVEYDNIAVTGLGSAAFTSASDYATAEQGKKADRAMALKGTIGSADATLESLPLTDVSVGDSYKAIGEFTIIADNSFTGNDVLVTVGDVIVCMGDNKWLVITSGTAESAKSLTKGIAANVTGGVIGSATAANAGETMEIVIKEINTDFIKLGSNTLLLNGGSASM